MDIFRMLAAAVLFCAASAAAEPKPAPEGAGKDACKADMEKFCKDVTPGEGRLKFCLKAYEDKVSAECREQMGKAGEKIREKMQEGKEACKADVEKFCKDVEPGKGGVVQCLKKHEGELSEACGKFHAKMAEHHRGMKEGLNKKKEACRGDVEKFCKGVEPGEGRLIKCLQEHKAELSKDCAQTHEDEGKKEPKPEGKK